MQNFLHARRICLAWEEGVSGMHAGEESFIFFHYIVANEDLE